MSSFGLHSTDSSHAGLRSERVLRLVQGYLNKLDKQSSSGASSKDEVVATLRELASLSGKVRTAEDYSYVQGALADV